MEFHLLVLIILFSFFNTKTLEDEKNVYLKKISPINSKPVKFKLFRKKSKPSLKNYQTTTTVQPFFTKDAPFIIDLNDTKKSSSLNDKEIKREKTIFEDDRLIDILTKSHFSNNHNSSNLTQPANFKTNFNSTKLYDQNNKKSNRTALFYANSHNNFNTVNNINNQFYYIVEKLPESFQEHMAFLSFPPPPIPPSMVNCSNNQFIWKLVKMNDSENKKTNNNSENEKNYIKNGLFQQKIEDLIKKKTFKTNHHGKEEIQENEKEEEEIKNQSKKNYQESNSFVKIANNKEEMEKMGEVGTIVYRKDIQALYIKLNKWKSFRLSVCGDGIKDADEECDDGNQNNNDYCKNDCKLHSCGDGVMGPEEECDLNLLNFSKIQQPPCTNYPYRDEIYRRCVNCEENQIFVCSKNCTFTCQDYF